MPKGYVIVRAEVTNPEKWAEYVTKSKVALEKFGGKPIVRGGKAEIIEGDGLARNVVLEFENFEKAEGYAKSAGIRRGQEGAAGRRHPAHGHRRRRLTPRPADRCLFTPSPPPSSRRTGGGGGERSDVVNTPLPNPPP